MKFIRDGFKSFYQSGTEFTEKFLPKILHRAGLPEKFSSPLGQAAGSFIGIASVVTGAYFLAAIPISMPMFLVASGILPVKGSIAAVIATTLLAGTGSVVGATGLGMCRAAMKGFRSTFAAARERFAKTAKPVPAAASEPPFNVAPTPAKDFKEAAKAAPESSQTQVQAAPARPRPAF